MKKDRSKRRKVGGRRSERTQGDKEANDRRKVKGRRRGKEDEKGERKDSEGGG